MLTTLFQPFQTKVVWNLKAIGAMQLVFLLALWLFMPASTGIPSLPAIGTAWLKLGQNEGLLRELFTSTVVIWQAIILSALISLLLAALSTAVVFKPIGALISSLRFLGFAGLTYLFTIWTSSSAELKLSLLTFGMTVFLTRSMIDVVSAVPQLDVDYGRTLGLSGWRLTWEVIIRGKLAEMLDLVRQNAAVGWTILSMVEGITRSEGGIGAMLLNTNKSFNLAGVLAIQLTILFYGLLQDVTLRYIIESCCPWTKLTRGGK